MNKHIKYMGLLLAPLFLSLFSCSSSSDNEAQSPYKTVLHEISIVGADGKNIMGKVNEITKRVSFPRLDADTDLTAVQFDAKLSEGANLDKESYNFSIKEGDAERTEIIKVINQERYREYSTTLRIKVPVFGADFDKVNLIDYSIKSGKPYPDFSSASVRSADFDGDHVLVVSRAGGINPHLLAVEDLKAGKTNPIKLNTEGISGGIFPVSSGKLMQGRVYITNMAGDKPNIYYWETPTSKPEIIFTGTEINATGAGRYGDSMAMYVDEKGNGFIFLENNSTNVITRLHIKNFKDIVKTDEINIKASSGKAGGQFFSLTKVKGTNYYLYTGFEAPLMLVDEGGNLVTQVSDASVPTGVNEAHIFDFNGKRYLAATTACRSGRNMPSETIYLYDITRGDNVVDALNLLESNNYKPVYQETLQGSGTTSPGTNCNYAIKDDILYVFGSGTDAGFMIVEAPKMVLEEEEF